MTEHIFRFSGIVERIKPLAPAFDSILFSDTVKSLAKNGSLIYIQLIEKNNDVIPGLNDIEQIFLKKIDEKYLGKVVDITTETSYNKDYVKQKIESADDSDSVTVPYDILKLIHDCYWGS